MRANFEVAKEWVLKDEHVMSLPGLSGLWDSLDLDRALPGLDYYLLDCAVCFGATTTGQWLDLVTGTRYPIEQAERVREMGVELLVSGLELFRRRRIKADPLWHRHGSEWSNRCNRVRRRALALAEQPAQGRSVLLVETA